MCIVVAYGMYYLLSVITQENNINMKLITLSGSSDIIYKNRQIIV